jgi:chaperonin GroES
MRIVLNCDRVEDIEWNDAKEIVNIIPTEYFTKYSFIPAPDGGFYDSGFGVLMGPLNESVNTAINQLFDAGTVQNMGGGWLGRGAKMKAGQTPFKPGEWKTVDSTGDDLRKNMVPVPTVEPSQVLFQLLGLLIEYTNLLAGSTDTVLGKNPGQNTPAETSRNMTESGLQIYSTIFKRIWRSMKEEFKKYHVLNRKYLPDTTTFGQGKYTIKREDYLTNPDWVRPAADPNIVSAGQRLGQASAIRDAAYNAPGGYDIEAVERNFLRAMRVQNLAEIFPGFEAFPPSTDPKVQIEQMRTQIDQADQELEQWKFIKEWQEAIRLNSAKIQLLEAQAVGIFADIEDTRKASVTDAYRAFIEGLQSVNTMLSGRIDSQVKLMQERNKSAGAKKDGDGKGKSGSGVRRVANVSTRGSSQPSAREMATGDAGPVGFGLPGGFTK